MADTAVAPAVAKTPKKGAAAKGKKQPKPTHPPYKNMISAAIKNLKERSGSSRQAILKYIASHYKVGDEKKAGVRLRLALRKCVAAGDIKQIKGSGASGSFRLAKDDKAPAKKVAKKTTKKPSAAKPKKPAAKKATKAKKPAAKKPTTPKKPAAKKAKKPAAKKSPKKAAPKKAAAKKPAKK